MGTVELEVSGAIAVATISAPQTRNALTAEMGRQLTQLCDEVDGNPQVGALVLKGANGTFCSGADRRAWKPGVDPADDDDFQQVNDVYLSFLRIGNLAVPSVAAVRGAAVGAGLNLALATDIRVVSADARLLGGFLAAGIHPGGGFYTLANRIGGRETAASLGLFSQEISGERAAALGLATMAVADSDVEEVAIATAGRPAKDPALARRAKAILSKELGPPPVSWDAAIEMERGTQMWSRKRQRQWKGE